VVEDLVSVEDEEEEEEEEALDELDIALEGKAKRSKSDG
jgi:hypothetical protein